MPGLSVKLPLVFDVNDGPYKLIKDFNQLAHQNLKSLILTNPGERVMDPDFGVGIRRMLFEPAGPSLYDTITTRINSQVEIYLPYIEIKNVNFIEPADNVFSAGSIAVEISYLVTTSLQSNVLSINL